MANETTLSALVNPQVMADMVEGKVGKHIRILPFAKVDTTLQGIAGSTITVPQWGHIGDAGVVNENAQISNEALSTSTVSYTVKKYAKGVTLTDEAVLSGYGDPVGETANQLANSIDQALDAEGMAQLEKTNQFHIASTALKYTAVVDAIDIFAEEINTPKVMFIHPNQVKTLRKDSDFISLDKYGAGTNVMMYGEIGMICNTRVVVSKRVEKNAEFYYKVTSSTSGALKIVASGASTGEVNLATVEAKAIDGYTPAVNDYVLDVSANTYYINPIVRIASEDEVETGIPALTVFIKRGILVEPKREADYARTGWYATKHCVVALTNKANVCKLYATV